MPDDDVRRLRVAQAEEVIRALWLIGEDLLGKATPLAPIEEATLRGSGAVVLIVNGTRHEGDGALASALAHVRSIAAAGGSWTADVEVSFNTIYAARQHEETTWKHPLGGQAKYLEQPFRDNVDRYERILEAAHGRGVSR